jgi:hypothetical protein
MRATAGSSACNEPVSPTHLDREHDAVNAEVRKVERIHERLLSALSLRDRCALDLLLSPKFVCLVQDGRFMNRATLARVIARLPSPIRIEATCTKVGIEGEAATLTTTFNISTGDYPSQRWRCRMLFACPRGYWRIDRAWLQAC